MLKRAGQAPEAALCAPLLRVYLRGNAISERAVALLCQAALVDESCMWLDLAQQQQ